MNSIYIMPLPNTEYSCGHLYITCGDTRRIRYARYFNANSLLYIFFHTQAHRLDSISFVRNVAISIPFFHNKTVAIVQRFFLIYFSSDRCCYD